MKILPVLAIVFFTLSASAGTIFEPSLSLGSASGELNTALTTPQDSTATTATFGFRYGITRRYINVTGILEGMIFSSSEDGAETELIGFGGLGIGYEWNIPLRTYIIFGAYDFDTDFIGTGAEISYFLSDRMWLGVRYMNVKTEIGAVVGAVDIKADIDMSSYSVVLSFPFEFNYPDHWFRKTDWE